MIETGSKRVNEEQFLIEDKEGVEVIVTFKHGDKELKTVKGKGMVGMITGAKGDEGQKGDYVLISAVGNNIAPTELLSALKDLRNHVDSIAHTLIDVVVEKLGDILGVKDESSDNSEVH